jgi:hypothetical protein
MYLFGMCHLRQQAQVALGQQFSLARPGRRLDDKGVADIQRTPALFGIGDG